MNYNELRKKYPVFRYKKYNIDINANDILIQFTFEIDNLSVFKPTIYIPKTYLHHKVDINSSIFQNIVFSMGMAELPSYWKATCSPMVVVEAGNLHTKQIEWWKKLYFNGLGEFFYLNGLMPKIADFMQIKCDSTKPIFDTKTVSVNNESLIPVGGGKDSVVTLEILKDFYEKNAPIILNPRQASLETARIAGYTETQIVQLKRTICKNLLSLNARGFLNGHTPFSAVLAFTTLFQAFLMKKKYIVLSNEDSANEATIPNTNINHQYSKSLEFENDFNHYTKHYITPDIHYFSLLRPLNEFRIATLFSKYKKYHKAFKSCNVGSKQDIWCGKCSKCLFVFIMLAPHLSTHELIDIFGYNLFENTDLKIDFEKLSGLVEEKPFECVGTINEVNAALYLICQNHINANIQMPFLLDYWYKKKHDSISNISIKQAQTYFSNKHNIPNIFLEKLLKLLNSL